jgi:hypothetical protein
MTTTPTSADTVHHGWVPYAAIAAGAGLVLMPALVIGTRDEMLQAPTTVLYLGSVVVALAAAVGTGLRAQRGRRALVAVVLCFAVIAWVMALGDLFKPLLSVFGDEDYLLENGPIAMLGLALLLLGARARTASPRA